MLKKHIIGTGFILCVLAGTGAQTVTLDSLRGVYLASKSDSAFWYNSCLLGAVFFRSDLDSALLYSEISLDYARKAGKPNMISVCTDIASIGVFIPFTLNSRHTVSAFFLGNK